MTIEEKKSTGVFRHISKYVGILLGSIAFAGVEIGRACQNGAKAAGKLLVPGKNKDEEAPQAAEPVEAVEAAATGDVETPEPAPAEEPAKDAAEEPTPEPEPEAKAEKTEEPIEDGEKKTPPSSIEVEKLVSPR